MRLQRICVLFFMVAVFCSGTYAQTGYRDSLRKCFYSDPLVKNKVEAVINLSGSFVGDSQFDSAFSYIDLAIPLAEKDSLEDQLASLYTNKAVGCIYMGANTPGLKAIMVALQISEKLKDSSSLANDYNIVGIIHLNMKSFSKARSYWLKGLKINQLTRNEENEIDSYGNLGTAEAELHNFDSALFYFDKSLQLTRKFKSHNKEVITLMDIGDVYTRMKKFNEALDYTLQSIEKSKEQGMEMKNPKVYLNLGLIYTGLKKYALAHENFEKSIQIEKIINNPDDYRQIYEGLSDLYAKENNFSKAYECHVLYSNYNDSVYNNENLQSISDIKTKYEVEKKEEEFKLRAEKEQLRNEAELKKQKLIQVSLAIGFVMLAILAFFIFRGYRIKKKANEVILKQKDEIETKKAELESAYTEIQDSINYAKRIQQASLPALEKLKDVYPDSCVVYRPKNVVSGDFYYFNEVEENGLRTFILAVCDCTGHGVPGAFMSMIGIEQLNKIIVERKVYQPSLILDSLHTGVREALNQEVNESRDGMDVILCRITQDGSNMNIEYAGANRPLWILRKTDDAVLFEEIKADKQAVGGLESGVKPKFTNCKVTVKKGDIIYCSTDGYADQFGGDKGKKLMVKNFQSLLIGMAADPMSVQEKNIIDKYKEWKGRLEQVDDVCVIGIRF